MKSIYKVILGVWLSTLSFSALALDAPTALVPAGLNPGDQFYVMFKSVDNIAGNLSVSQYNSIVNADADTASIGPGSGLTWSAFMNHENAAGTTTEQTLSLFAANTAAPVYTTAGGQIASNRVDLFDAAIDTAINFQADGELGTNGTVWTGSAATGLAASPLGDSLAESEATDGISIAVDFTWIANGTYTKTVTTSRIYAVSPLLVVPGPIADNDVATVAVNVSVDIDVLANDSAGSDPIDASTVAVQTAPVNGNITNVNTSNGIVTYMPNANYEGIDSFTYLVKDTNNVNSNIATVSITVTAASGGGSSGGMDWSLLLFFLALSLLRTKVRK